MLESGKRGDDHACVMLRGAEEADAMNLGRGFGTGRGPNLHAGVQVGYCGICRRTRPSTYGRLRHPGGTSSRRAPLNSKRPRQQRQYRSRVTDSLRAVSAWHATVTTRASKFEPRSTPAHPDPASSSSEGEYDLGAEVRKLCLSKKQCETV